MPDFDQLGRREAIRLLFDGTPYAPFADVAFLAAAGESVVPASRVLLEGIDFDLVYFPLKHLGYKAVALVTGELYAALASPRSLSVVLGVSAKLDFARVKELWGGVVAAASEFGFSGVSLDLQPSRNGLTISVAAVGCASAEERPQPASKDLLCVSGALGAAYLGLQVLERGKARFDGGAEGPDGELERYRMLVASYLKPELPVALPEQLKESGITPSAALFVDRGLADALLRLIGRTGLGAKVYADRIPFEGGSFDLGKSLDLDPVSAAMNGGDDCRVLLVVPIAQFERFRHDFQAFDIIGHLAQSDVGAVLVSPDGLEHPVSAPGWPSNEQPLNH
ncbi:MAG: thiamine-phosphate kinase [Bacteroidales bacterium]|nr:thiamine-phosphate kinase [Bacteroidales bacterium]